MPAYKYTLKHGKRVIAMEIITKKEINISKGNVHEKDNSNAKIFSRII